MVVKDRHRLSMIADDRRWSSTVVDDLRRYDHRLSSTILNIFRVCSRIFNTRQRLEMSSFLEVHSFLDVLSKQPQDQSKAYSPHLLLVYRLATSHRCDLPSHLVARVPEERVSCAAQQVQAHLIFSTIQPRRLQFGIVFLA